MRKYIFLFIMMGLVVVSRIVPHPWNFTPIGAVGFLGAYYFRPWWLGIVASFAAIIVSDSVIGFYHWPILVSVYLGFALYAVFGGLAKTSPLPSPCKGEGDGDVLPSIKRGLGGVSQGVLFVLFGSLTFFLLTNSAVWLFGTMYPHTLDGLIAALVAGIPFYRNMLFGDILYIGMPLAVIEYVKMRSALTAHVSEGS